MYYPILLLISFLIFKIFRFEFEINTNEIYSLTSFIKETPLNIKRCWYQFKNPKFMMIKSLVFFIFYIIKPFQLIISLFYVIYFICFINNNIGKKKIFFNNVMYIDNGLLYIIYIYIPKAGAYNICYDIYKRLYNQNEKINKKAYFIIIFNIICSKIFMSTSNINFINSISMNIYNILYEKTIHSFFLNNLKGKSKIKFLFIIIKDSICNTILWNSKYLYNANNKKIIIKNNKIIFNPWDKMKFLTYNEMIALYPQYKIFGDGYSYTKGMYINHPVCIDGLFNTYSNFSTNILFSHRPLYNQKSIIIEKNQYLIYNSFLDQNLIKETYNDYNKLNFLDREILEEYQINALMGRIRNDCGISLQTSNNINFFNSTIKNYFENIYNLKNNNLVNIGYLTNVEVEIALKIIEKKNRYRIY